jgi:hypothetical protein
MKLRVADPMRPGIVGRSHWCSAIAMGRPRAATRPSLRSIGAGDVLPFWPTPNADVLRSLMKMPTDSTWSEAGAADIGGCHEGVGAADVRGC